MKIWTTIENSSIENIEDAMFLLSKNEFRWWPKSTDKSTDKALELLASSELGLMNVTLKVLPAMVRQLFTIFARVFGIIVPLMGWKLSLTKVDANKYKCIQTNLYLEITPRFSNSMKLLLTIGIVEINILNQLSQTSI